jgi:hypothetical protein
MAAEANPIPEVPPATSTVLLRNRSPVWVAFIKVNVDGTFSAMRGEVESAAAAVRMRAAARRVVVTVMEAGG